MAVMSVTEVQSFLAEHFPQIEPMRMRVEQVENGSVTVRMPIGEQHLRPGGTVSGMTQMALCDNTMYALTLAQLGPVALAVTTSLNINFLRKPSATRDMIAKARVLKRGKRLLVGEVSLYSEGEGEPVAHSTMTYSIPPGRS